jgi:glycosyltransferase involved in cell wall biosynthesis
MQYEVDHWVYIAEKNKIAFKLDEEPKNMSKVFNGYEYEVPKIIYKENIGIRKNSFVFCLVSRAMESKGWIVTCEAIKRLNIMGYKFDLILIGSGEAVDIVREKYNYDYIHLTGQISNVEDYVSISDVGLLPSSFIGESMPLVLIEYMAQGKPIISTDVGEIVNMTTDKKGRGAIIIDLVEEKVQVKDLLEAMISIYEDKELISNLSYNSKRLFKVFDMKNMINSYKNIYDKLIKQ